MSPEATRYEFTAREHKHIYLGLDLPHIVFEVKEAPRPELLCCAARQAVNMHPLFATSLRCDGLYYLEADPDWEQHPEGAVIAGGAGRHLWDISCSENRIIFSASHALTDAMGLVQFAATVFHLYFELCGFRFSEAANCDLPADPGETTLHPVELLPHLQEPSLGVPGFPPPSSLSDDYFSMDESDSFYLVELSESSIRRFATQSETSVFSVIACLLARTVEEAFNMDKGCISVRVPVNYRKAFGTYSDHNFSQGFSLCYRPEKMSQLPDALVETAFRSQLDIFTDRSNMAASLRKDCDRLQALKDGKVTYDSFRRMAPESSSPLALVSYSHLTRLGFSDELSRMFDRIFFARDDSIAHSMLVGAVTSNGRICMSIYQHVVNQQFINAFIHSLEKKGIEYEMREVSLSKLLGK